MFTDQEIDNLIKMVGYSGNRADAFRIYRKEEESEAWLEACLEYPEYDHNFKHTRGAISLLMGSFKKKYGAKSNGEWDAIAYHLRGMVEGGLT